MSLCCLSLCLCCQPSFKVPSCRKLQNCLIFARVFRRRWRQTVRKVENVRSYTTLRCKCEEALSETANRKVEVYLSLVLCLSLFPYMFELMSVPVFFCFSLSLSLCLCLYVSVSLYLSRSLWVSLSSWILSWKSSSEMTKIPYPVKKVDVARPCFRNVGPARLSMLNHM